MAEQQARHAEQSKGEAQESVRQLEEQVSLLTRELHQAREARHSLQLHFEVGVNCRIVVLNSSGFDTAPSLLWMLQQLYQGFDVMASEGCVCIAGTCIGECSIVSHGG